MLFLVLATESAMIVFHYRHSHPCRHKHAYSRPHYVFVVFVFLLMVMLMTMVMMNTIITIPHVSPKLGSPSRVPFFEVAPSAGVPASPEPQTPNPKP